MAMTGHSCCDSKPEEYLLLLHFARISRIAETQVPERHHDIDILEALRPLSASIDPAITPLLPLIYHNTARTGLRCRLPPELTATLKNGTMRLVAQDLANRQWLLRNLEAFEKAHIPVILLKGAAFAGTLYPDNTPRLGIDLDLLVTGDCFDDACAILGRTMNPVLLSDKRSATHDTLFERVFTPRDGGIPTVELHRDLTNPSIFHINQQRLWEASRRHPVYNSESVRLLSPEDTLLHLAVHAFRDLDFCNHNILDAHEVWCQWHPDPESLTDRATQWGARKALFYLLATCQASMGTPVSDTLLNSLKPSRICDGINRKILQSPVPSTTDRNTLGYRLIQLMSQLTFPDRLLWGIRFQVSYARLRVHDWIIGLRNRPHASL